MEMIKMPSGEPLCLLYSAAMILEETPSTLKNEIGHSGLKIWWKFERGNMRYRGHHIQEIINCCIKRNRGLMPIDYLPNMSPRPGIKGRLIEDSNYLLRRFKNITKNKRGILIGKSKSGINHACAWDGKKVYDPNGQIYDIDDFNIKECWILL